VSRPTRLPRSGHRNRERPGGRNRDHQARTVDPLSWARLELLARVVPGGSEDSAFSQAEVTIAPWLELFHLGHDTPLGTIPGPLCGIAGQRRHDPGVEQLEFVSDLKLGKPRTCPCWLRAAPLGSRGVDRIDHGLVPDVSKILDVIQDVTQGTRRNADWADLRSGPPTQPTSACTPGSRNTGRLGSLLIVAPYLSFIFGKKASPPSSGSGVSGTETSLLPRALRFRYLLLPSSTPVTVSRPPMQ
jgi:hypothetical protein